MNDEPEMIVFLRERLARAEAEGREDSMPGATLVSPGPWRNIGRVRPELLCVNANGERVYMLTVRQVRKLLDVWDQERSSGR